MIRTETITHVLTATSGSEISPHVVSGRILAVYVEYAASTAATTDVTIATLGKAAPAMTILTRTDTATSGWFYPRVLLDDTSGADLTAVYDALPVDDHLKVTIAQSTSGKTIRVYVLYE